jgi:hypothetical protein
VAAPLAKSAVPTTIGSSYEALNNKFMESIGESDDVGGGYNAERFGAEFLGVQVVVEADEHRLVLMNVW